MNDLRTAAQQALEALEQSETFVPYEGFGMARRKAESKHQAAIIALRAALAEPTPLEDVVTHGSAWSKDGKRIDPMSVYAEPVHYVQRRRNE